MVTNLPFTSMPLLYSSCFSPWKASNSIVLRPCNQGKLAWAQLQSVFFLCTFYIHPQTHLCCSLKQWFSALTPKSFSRMKLQKGPGCLLVWMMDVALPTSCVHGQNNKWPLGFFLYGNLSLFSPSDSLSPRYAIILGYICIFICFTSQQILPKTISFLS